MSLSKAAPSSAVAHFNQDVIMDDANMSREQADHIKYVLEIVQNQGTSTMPEAGLKDSKKLFDFWNKFLTKYPFPFFDYLAHKQYKLEKTNFTLGVDTELVGDVLGSQAPTDARQDFINALKRHGGKALEVQTKAERLTYVAIIREYATASRLRLFHATLDADIKEVKTLCGGTESMHLKIDMESTEFEINNELALALYPKLSQLEEETACKVLSVFVRAWSQKKNQEFQAWLVSQNGA